MASSISVLRAQHLAFGEMRKRAAGRRRQGLPDKFFRAAISAAAESLIFIDHAGHQRGRQQALRLDRPRIERQRALEQLIASAWLSRVRRLRNCGASPEDVIQRIGMLGRPGGLRANPAQGRARRRSGCVISSWRANRSTVSLSKRSAHRCASASASISWAVMRTAVARSPDAPFEHIAHPQFAADLLRVDRLVPVGERGIARDHEACLRAATDRLSGPR